MKKTFKIAQVRDLLNQVYNEKITFSRFVEILNENAISNIHNTKQTRKYDDIIVPFTKDDIKQLIGKTIKNKDGDIIFMITSFIIDIDNTLYIINNDVYISTEVLLEDYLFFDGSICGKQKMES